VSIGGGAADGPLGHLPRVTTRAERLVGGRQLDCLVSAAPPSGGGNRSGRIRCRSGACRASPPTPGIAAMTASYRSPPPAQPAPAAAARPLSPRASSRASQRQQTTGRMQVHKQHAFACDLWVYFDGYLWLQGHGTGAGGAAASLSTAAQTSSPAAPAAPAGPAAEDVRDEGSEDVPDEWDA
jgi:hypothetical protein